MICLQQWEDGAAAAPILGTPCPDRTHCSVREDVVGSKD